ncbi:AAA family ATPase [Nocardia sp. NPDC004085]|uniref:AAA family ATPase n=1 Tax=Nocardia sp. NPDC019255 TaxID=3154591 RepID=UPI0033C9C7A3
MGEPDYTPDINCGRHQSYQPGCKNCERQLEQFTVWERQQKRRNNSEPLAMESDARATDSSAPEELQHFPTAGLQPGEETRSTEGFSESRGPYPQLTATSRQERRPDTKGKAKPRYVDMAALLNGTLPKSPAPTVCRRNDGIGLFYRAQYNVVFGDPESGKTLLTDYATVQELAVGGRVLRLDLDDNGPEPTLRRLIAMGADPEVVTDHDRFLYIEPEDAAELLTVIDDVADRRPTLVILDSLGQLIPMFGGSSNSADEFTICHRRVIKPLIRTDACVVAIDHLAKGEASRSYGAGGTAAKKRAVGGISLRVKVDASFTPGRGGSAHLTINKDRHGGLRANCPVDVQEPYAGKFVLLPDEDAIRAEIQAPDNRERIARQVAVAAGDVDAVAALNPPASSAREARTRLGWGDKRAREAYASWKARENEKRWPTGSAA